MFCAPQTQLFPRKTLAHSWRPTDCSKMFAMFTLGLVVKWQRRAKCWPTSDILTFTTLTSSVLHSQEVPGVVGFLKVSSSLDFKEADAWCRTSPSCGVEGGGSVTEKIVNQGDKRSFIAGLRAQARGSKEHSGMLHSWTMLFLTVPLAAGREGDSCGPQGSCLLCHGPTARYFNGTCFSTLLQKMDPVFNTWHTEYKMKSHTWYLSFFYTGKIFGEENLHRNLHSKLPIYTVNCQFTQ